MKLEPHPADWMVQFLEMLAKGTPDRASCCAPDILIFLKFKYVIWYFPRIRFFFSSATCSGNIVVCLLHQPPDISGRLGTIGGTTLQELPFFTAKTPEQKWWNWKIRLELSEFIFVFFGSFSCWWLFWNFRGMIFFWIASAIFFFSGHFVKNPSPFRTALPF